MKAKIFRVVMRKMDLQPEKIINVNQLVSIVGVG